MVTVNGSPWNDDLSTIDEDSTEDSLQMSTRKIGNEEVVRITNAYKYYDVKTNPLVVLDGLSMTVTKGTIYALLGPSGCGKTTLLNCILGQRQLKSGEIRIFGKVPSSFIAGLRTGYMPQEVALYGDFTIRETFIYFGWVAGMNNGQIEGRFNQLSELLLLPHGSQRIKTLSGGEQRRVSFAAAILHEPELLILDEPTVGTDPLLREAIWNHLIQITKEQGTTVILTTHYIEETRQANVVALMRNGRLLAEEAPGNLVTQYGVESLEEIFFKLSVVQNINLKQSVTCQKENSAVSVIYNANDNEIAFEGPLEDTPATKESTRNDGKFAVQVKDCLPTLKANHLKAEIWKNVLWWMRNFPTLLFMIILPGLSISLFCLTVGSEPKNLSVAIINYETNNTDTCNSTLLCDSKQLSCHFLQKLRKHSLVMINYESEVDARRSVLQGKIVASVVLRHNYSEALTARIDHWQKGNAWDIEYSTIDVLTDSTNKFGSSFVKLHLYDTFQNFFEDYLQACGINLKSVRPPLHLEFPVYEVNDPSYTDFVIPGILLSCIFSVGLMLTSLAMLTEQTQGTFERTFAIGVTRTELLIGHVVCESVIMVAEVVLAVTCAFAIFDMTQRGSLLLVLLLMLSSAFCGMCYGLLVSCFCESDITINLVCVGTLFPVLSLSGAVWPIEGMHYLLKPLAMILPLTKPTEGLRSVLQKNWDLSADTVVMGFVSTSVWILIFLVLSLICLKFKR